jgi:hypothetical protein
VSDLIENPSASAYLIQARDGRGAWRTVCTDTIEPAAQATARYFSRRYEVETRVVLVPA